MTVLYLIGSLRNPDISELSNLLQNETGYEIFSSWKSPGPTADDEWRDYAKARGWSYREALREYAATHVYEFDKFHLDRADAAILVMPAGKSGHMELGYMIGQGKPCFYLLEPDNERWDVMIQLCFENGGNVCSSVDELLESLEKLEEVSNAKPNYDLSAVCSPDDIYYKGKWSIGKVK